MANIDATQDSQITFMTGIDASGILVARSFWTWNNDSPATYSSSPNYTAKFGPGTAGTGATISYAFDPASNWSSVEQQAFVQTAALWSAVANITFVAGSVGSADITLSRATDGSASGGQSTFFPGATGTARVGRATEGGMAIDTSTPGFGPLGAAFSEYGGYPYTTLIHEWGHVLGLGHGGPYDEGASISETANTIYDNRAWTIMSYLDPDSSFRWGTSRSSNGLSYGNDPTTPMMLDILAIQRIYGVAVNTPLSGGQTYGFNSNIGGDIGKFFDFTQNSRPIVTLWNKGVGNTLDLSGFSQDSTVDLRAGSFSSVAGLTKNIAIAYDTRIDSLILGTGNDVATANDNSDVVMGGLGADSITGGSGNDHLYGAAATALAGDGADTLNAGAGSDYLQGNAGDDSLNGQTGSDRIFGGQGNDRIDGGDGNDSVNGNLGNDSIAGGNGSDSLRGGQGNDSISGDAGDDLLIGDLGADTLSGGSGIDRLTGGGDADLFLYANGDAAFLSSALDSITDFADGIDRIRLGFTPTSVTLLSATGSLDATAASAAQIINAAGSTALVATTIGGDVYLFYDTGPTTPLEAIRLSGLNDAGLIGLADFG
ncbi:MAG: M10 family metallopeptidase C-terminal domain-containing protein [Pseudomonadota bacterium]